MNRYLVTVERTIVQWIDVEVEAYSKVDARVLALHAAKAAPDGEWDSIPDTGDDLEVTETVFTD